MGGLGARSRVYSFGVKDWESGFRYVQVRQG